MRSLSIASRQMVEIAKAVSFESDVLIMDEPTSALTEHEVEHLFRIIRDLKARGKGIVYITHKMNELFEIADEVSVFRDGRYIGTEPADRVTRDDIIKMMVGREITQMFPKETVPIGDVVLSVRDLCLDGVFRDIAFDVRAGEILGFAGLIGSGRSNVAEALFGVNPATSGTITIRGERVSIDKPADGDGPRHGVPHRGPQGHRLLPHPRRAREHADGGARPALCPRRVRQRAGGGPRLRAMRSALRIKTPNLAERIENLSGGNQQKVLIGRWLLTKPKILILDEPTRGIDCRRQGRDPQAHHPARRRGRRGHHDLVGAARGARH